MFNDTVAAKFSTHARIKHGIVAYRSTFLRPNVCEKIHQFLSNTKKDAHKRKLVLLFCFTVYILNSQWLFATDMTHCPASLLAYAAAAA